MPFFLSIRRARPADSALISALLCEHAEHEKLTDEVEATEADIDSAPFVEDPRLFCDIAEWNGKSFGFAFWFFDFSTFAGRPGLFPEELFVRPAHRGRGIGKALLAHLAKLCVENGWSRVQWSVLDRNIPSTGFYRSPGAATMHKRKQCKVAGAVLTQLAQAVP